MNSFSFNLQSYEDFFFFLFLEIILNKKVVSFSEARKTFLYRVLSGNYVGASERQWHLKERERYEKVTLFLIWNWLIFQESYQSGNELLSRVVTRAQTNIRHPDSLKETIQ